jgi:hypothetical protein
MYGCTHGRTNPAPAQARRDFVDPTTARGVDALIEGLVMHRTLAATAGAARADIRVIVARVTGEGP